MRIIDADELKALRELYIQGKLQFVKNEYDLIDKCPTIDAEPVRHGRWEYQYNDSICSECGYVNRCNPITRYRNDTLYCPDCGAKMDLKE